MIRKIIHIDEEKCNGCGACVTACHEGAIGLVNGKAKLMRDDYCDGFGDCLPGCPTGAITFTEREAAAYDEQAVLENKQKKAAAAQQQAQPAAPAFHGCPGSMMKQFHREQTAPAAAAVPMQSQLAQWPCQIKLVPVNAPYFDGAKLLIAVISLSMSASLRAASASRSARRSFSFASWRSSTLTRIPSKQAGVPSGRLEMCATSRNQ